MDLDPQHRVLRVTLGSVVNDGILLAADVEVRKFLAKEGADFGIFDYSAVITIEVTSQYVQTVAGNLPAVPPMKLRIAVAPNPAVFGMNRMYEILIEGKRSDFRVVHTMEEAETLLGFGPLDFSRTL